MNLVNILHLRHNNCLSWLQIWRVKRKILFGPILWGSLGTCEETWRVTTTGCWFVVVIVVDLHRLHSHEYSVWNFIFEEDHVDYLINIPLDFMSPVCRLQNAAVFILVFMSACLHIGKALIIKILVKDAASLDYKERSSRRCIGEGCLDDLNFAAGAVW